MQQKRDLRRLLPVCWLFWTAAVIPSLGCASDHFLGELEPVDLAGNGAGAHTTEAESARDFTVSTLLDPPDVSMDAEAGSWDAIVASVGDVDGDGYGDFASRSWDTTGRHYLHLRYGGPRPLDPQAEFALAVGGARLTLDTQQHLFIETITAVGDVDGDGRDDFLLGLGRCNPTVEGQGAYLVYGSAARLEGVHRLADAAVFLKSPRPVGARHDLGSCELRPAGSFAAALGDFDGDGLDDFVVAEPRLIPLDNYPEPSPAVESVAYLFYGQRERIRTGTSLASADARLHAEQDLVLTPTSDANADGLGDLILGDTGGGLPESWWDVPAPWAHYWLPGRAERLTGDVDLAALAPLVAPAMAAGDLDGDGVSDVLLYDDAGQQHLFYGAPGLFDAGVDVSQSAATFQAYGWESSGTLVRLNDRDGDGDDELGLLQFVRQRLLPPAKAALLAGTSFRRSGEIGLIQPSNPFGDDSGLSLEGIFPVGDLDGDGAGDLVTRSGFYSPELQSGHDPLLHIHYGKPGAAGTPLR